MLRDHLGELPVPVDPVERLLRPLPRPVAVIEVDDGPRHRAFERRPAWTTRRPWPASIRAASSEGIHATSRRYLPISPSGIRISLPNISSGGSVTPT